MLGQLSRKEEPDSGLDLPGGDGGPLVVMGKTAGLGGDALKDVVDKGCLLYTSPSPRDS